MSNPVSFYRINSIRSCVTGAASTRDAVYLHEIKSTVMLHSRFTSDFYAIFFLSKSATIRLYISFTWKIS